MKTIDIMTLNTAVVEMTLDFVWMSYRGTHILTGSLLGETLRKCPYSAFFWSIFSRIQTFRLNEERYSVSLHSVRMG